MPILKQFVQNANQSKRRSRADLTAEMISAPLGDFRHTMHVGRGGDAFGDTSFLSTRSGEPPREPEPKQASPGPDKPPGLLSRTFRSSKRSLSVNRGDALKYERAAPPAGGSSPGPVKNAVSLPYLNEQDARRGGHLTKSVSSSPAKRLSEGFNGAAATLDREFDDELDFGDLTDLPPSSGPRGHGMKHAESIMSFHIDLGPSMLGDILSVMERRQGWEEEDLGYEEEGGGGEEVPPAEEREEDEVEERRRPPARPPRTMYPPQRPALDPYTPPDRRRHPDSCSLSSSSSAAPEEKRHSSPPQDDTYSSPPQDDDDRDFSFMDDEDDDEIRV